jgi:hypothetical protein
MRVSPCRLSEKATRRSRIARAVSSVKEIAPAEFLKKIEGSRD